MLLSSMSILLVYLERGIWNNTYYPVILLKRIVAAYGAINCAKRILSTRERPLSLAKILVYRYKVIHHLTPDSVAMLRAITGSKKQLSSKVLAGSCSRGTGGQNRLCTRMNRLTQGKPKLCSGSAQVHSPSTRAYSISGQVKAAASQVWRLK